MSFKQRGMYWDLVSHCWLEGGLPGSPIAIARLLNLPAPPKFVKDDWPAIEPCFRLVDGRYQHPRLDKERDAQRLWREKSSAGGRRAQANRNHKATTVEPPLQPNVNQRATTPQPNTDTPSPVSCLQSASPDSSQKNVPAADARSKRPVFKGSRFVVFEWQLDDLRKMLGSHFDAFDMHQWLSDLDVKVDRANVVVPQRDSGKWLYEQTLDEAIRRGLPVVTTSQGTGKTAGNAAAIARFIKRGESA